MTKSRWLKVDSFWKSVYELRKAWKIDLKNDKKSFIMKKIHTIMHGIHVQS